MNRILYEAGDLQDDRLWLTGDAARHVVQVLKSRPGDRLRTGEINGPLSEATVLRLEADRVELRVKPFQLPPRPRVDLILALPRPKALRRLLSRISALGVDRLWLCGAAKVEACYFDSHVLEPERLRHALLEGLIQSGDTRLPEVKVHRRLTSFLRGEGMDCARDASAWLLHPGAETRLLQAPLTQSRAVLAIGPEGGWIPDEIERFQEAGFHVVSLLDRILTTDTACIAALSLTLSRLESGGGGDHVGT